MTTFTLPPSLEATAPPEARGLRRDEVRLLVAHPDGRIDHRRFTDLAMLLGPGDTLVVNRSATLPAALDARTEDGEDAALHLSNRLPAGLWAVELRHRDGGRTAPWFDAPRATLALPGGATGQLLVRQSRRLWVAALELTAPPLAYLARYGKPVRYGYVDGEWPISAYQTVFADEPGSAEMPSAARPFSAELVTQLVTRGVMFAPFVLHAGVSSPEAHEPPMAEWYRVPRESADVINRARRVIAVGTTAVRALETVADDGGAAGGRVHPGEGWTELVVSPEHRVRAVDGLITGWHEPEASHLAMLEAVAGREVLDASYRSALEEGYLWHEFGDSHLILR